MGGERVLLVFAKAPRPGKVKTRLAAHLGAERALGIYRQMAEGIWSNLRSGKDNRDFSLWLCFDPPAEQGSLRSWLPGADNYLAQSPGDLGCRLKTAIQLAFDEGFRQVAVVGTDCPAVTAARVVEGFEASAPGALSIGPCQDGGFYLLALRSPTPDLGPLFDHGVWSSPDTARTVEEGAIRQGLKIRRLASERDIDTIQDWDDFQD